MTEPFIMLPKTLAARVDLTSTDKIVLACLRDRIGSNGHCWPGYRKLAYDLGMDKTTIMHSVTKLAKLGEISILKGANGQSNTYKMDGESVRNARTGCTRNTYGSVRNARTERERPIRRPRVRPK